MDDWGTRIVSDCAAISPEDLEGLVAPKRASRESSIAAHSPLVTSDARIDEVPHNKAPRKAECARSSLNADFLLTFLGRARFVFLLGLPGSGKTLLAQTLHDHMSFKILSPLTSEKDMAKLSSYCKHFKFDADTMTYNTPRCVFDDTFTMQEDRATVLEVIEENSKIPEGLVVIIAIELPLEDILAKTPKENRKSLSKLAEEYEPVSRRKEGFYPDRVLTIRSQADFDLIREKVTRYLGPMLRAN